MNFQDAIKLILLFEGGYVNDPNDPGGETNFGISKRQYPHLDIRKITEAQARDIYKKDYWDKAKCEWLPASLRLIVFDCAVNQGVTTSIKYLQRSIGIKEDGIMGPITSRAVQAGTDSDILMRYWSLRFDNYTSNKNWNLYGKSWAKRLIEVSVLSALFATGKKEPEYADQIN